MIGVNAPPGSGKGTIVQILVFLMKLAAPGQLVRDDTTELAAEAGLRNRAAAASAHSAERALRVVNVSSDDLYMGREKRCLLYTSPSPRDGLLSRMPSSA